MNQPSIEELKALLDSTTKKKADIQEEYDLFPGQEKKYKRIGVPTFAQQEKVDEVRYDYISTPEAVRKEIALEYGWPEKEPSLNRLDYYQKIIPLVCLEKLEEIGKDFSTGEADRMIMDFLVSTYH